MKATALDRLASVALIIAAAVFVGSQLRAWRAPDAARTPTVPTYVEGEEVADWTLTMKPSKRTLLIFVNTACNYCAASMPLYGRLAERIQDSQDLRLVIASRERADVVSRYFAEHRVRARNIVTLAPGFAPKLRPTPTILLVDSNGRVERVWRGFLAGDGQQKLLAAVLGE